MIKTRLIPVIILKGEIVVQSFGFKKWLPIGNVKTAIEFFVNWDVDEILILDMEASRENRGPRLDIIDLAARECFLPLTVGGGIRSLETIRAVLNAGADKVSINSYALESPEFIRRAADRFGSQCITISIDARKTANGYEVFTANGKRATGKTPAAWAQEAERWGAGEIFLNSIDRDGSRLGYDIDLLKSVTSVATIPVIACGGVGQISHLTQGAQAGCQAVAAANIFQHTEHSTIAAKSHLQKSGVPVRLSSDVKYDGFTFDHLGRPL